MEITNVMQLKSAIAGLQSEEREKRSELIDQFHETIDNFKPINLIKDTFTKVIDTPGVVKSIVGTSVGVAAGTISKKLLVGKPTNIFKRLLGTFIQLAVSTAVARKM
jgi:hypothetical protein